MERRKSVTALTILASAFLSIAVAVFIVYLFVIKLTGFEGFVVINQDIFYNVIDIAKATNLIPSIITIVILGVGFLLLVIWLIVDIIRKRKTIILFALLLVIATYLELLYYCGYVVEFNFTDWTTILPLGGYFCGHIAAALMIALFIVDMATGRVEKQPLTFIQEPTPEVEEPVFEEIKEEDASTDEVKEAAPSEEEEEKPADTRKTTTIKKPNNRKTTTVKKADVNRKTTTIKKSDVARKTTTVKKSDIEDTQKLDKVDTRKTQTIRIVKDDGTSYAKAYHVSRRPELNKWQVKATGSDKALKLFNTQKEAIEYADSLAKSQNVSVRVHSKEGKIRKHN